MTEVALPLYEDEVCNAYIAPSPRQVLRIAINLKAVIDELVPAVIPPDQITSDSSIILTDSAMAAIRGAAGGEGKGKKSSARRYQASLVFCLLKVASWYSGLEDNQLTHKDLYATRHLAAETIAAVLIGEEQDDRYLFLSMLCHRYSINLNDEDSAPENALELAVDMHCDGVITSPGYQRCIKWLWRGWIVQSSHDPSEYVLFKGTSKTSFWYHFEPERISTPYYQNILAILFSLVYLVIYTVIVNTDTPPRNTNFFEALYYLFTIAYALDELIKFSHVGSNYLGFNSAFNDSMYAITLISLGVRIAGVAAKSDEKCDQLNTIAYRILSLVAPFMWARLLLFLDVYEFVGTTIVMIKRMMQESVIFFFLLAIILIGFLQAFLCLDQADGKRDLTKLIMKWLLRTILGGADFDSMERFAYPYASILYYSYTFIVVTVLLNILIALYSTAYAEVSDNATSEYLWQYSGKILRFVRAPDDKVFVPPFNLIEVFLLQIPLSWWLPYTSYATVCDTVMTIIYSPMLVWVASHESREAKRIQYNRERHVADDANEEDTEWDLKDGFDPDAEDTSDQIRESLRRQKRAELEDPTFAKNFEAWKASLSKISPPIETARQQNVLWEEYVLYDHIDKLTALVQTLIEQTKPAKASK